MPGSFKRVNYALRPAKSVERKMIAETVRRLSSLIPTRSFSYVGFGSPFFTDFILFHKALGIEGMTSIESQESKRARFDLNKPFKCVTLEYGAAGAAMRRLDWSEPMILWLDYDYPVSRSMLQDIRYAARRLAACSVLLVTADIELSEDPDERLNVLAKRIGTRNLPLDTELKSLDGWGAALVTRDIIKRRIENALSYGTAAHPLSLRRRYRQLFNFQYKDGARMVTTGGMILREDQLPAFDQVDFSGMSYVRRGPKPFRIRVPSLTYRELHYFDSFLPSRDLRQIDRKSIPLKDLQDYSSIYRFFPAFVEAEL